MILTCPQCATRYFLPDDQVGPGGRAVKCTQCGAVWRAAPEPEAGPQDEAPPAPAPEAWADHPTPPPGAGPEPEPEDELSAAAQRRAEIRKDQKAKAQHKARQAAQTAMAVWAGLAVAIVLLLVLAVAFRAQVVRYAPGLASGYAAVGLPVNASGLVIGKVRASPQAQAGRRVLAVALAIANTAGEARPVPAFRVRVLDKAGQALTEKTIALSAPPLKSGETRPVSLAVADPPAGYDTVEVTLAAPGAPAAAASGAH